MFDLFFVPQQVGSVWSLSGIALFVHFVPIRAGCSSLPYSVSLLSFAESSRLHRAQELAQALAYVHERSGVGPMLHRDIKNVSVWVLLWFCGCPSSSRDLLGVSSYASLGIFAPSRALKQGKKCIMADSSFARLFNPYHVPVACRGLCFST